MTELNLDAIEGRWEKPSEWVGGPDDRFHAIVDIDLLCAEVRRLRAERERLFDVVDRVEHFTADLWYNSHNGDKYEATIRGVRGIVGGVRDLLLPQSAAHPDTEGAPT